MMVDGHCVRDEGGSPYIGWLVAFHWISVGVRVYQVHNLREYVNHFLEKAVSYPQTNGTLFTLYNMDMVPGTK